MTSEPATRSHRIRIHTNADSLLATLDELRGLPKQLVQLLLDPADDLERLFRLQVDRLSAGSALHLVMSLEPSDRLRRLVVAARAGKLDGLVLEHEDSPAGSGKPAAGEAGSGASHAGPALPSQERIATAQPDEDLDDLRRRAAACARRHNDGLNYTALNIERDILALRLRQPADGAQEEAI